MSATSAFIGTTDYRPDLFFAELISGRSDFFCRSDLPKARFSLELIFARVEFLVP